MAALWLPVLRSTIVLALCCLSGVVFGLESSLNAGSNPQVTNHRRIIAAADSSSISSSRRNGHINIGQHEEGKSVEHVHALLAGRAVSQVRPVSGNQDGLPPAVVHQLDTVAVARGTQDAGDGYDRQQRNEQQQHQQQQQQQQHQQLQQQHQQLQQQHHDQQQQHQQQQHQQQHQQHQLQQQQQHQLQQQRAQESVDSPVFAAASQESSPVRPAYLHLSAAKPNAEARRERRGGVDDKNNNNHNVNNAKRNPEQQRPSEELAHPPPINGGLASRTGSVNQGAKAVVSLLPTRTTLRRHVLRNRKQGSAYRQWNIRRRNRIRQRAERLRQRGRSRGQDGTGQRRPAAAHHGPETAQGGGSGRRELRTEGSNVGHNGRAAGHSANGNTNRNNNNNNDKSNNSNHHKNNRRHYMRKGVRGQAGSVKQGVSEAQPHAGPQASGAPLKDRPAEARQQGVVQSNRKHTVRRSKRQLPPPAVGRMGPHRPEQQQPPSDKALAPTGKASGSRSGDHKADKTKAGHEGQAAAAAGRSVNGNNGVSADDRSKNSGLHDGRIVGIKDRNRHNKDNGNNNSKNNGSNNKNSKNNGSNNNSNNKNSNRNNNKSNNDDNAKDGLKPADDERKAVARNSHGRQLHAGSNNRNAAAVGHRRVGLNTDHGRGNGRRNPEQRYGGRDGRRGSRYDNNNDDEDDGWRGGGGDGGGYDYGGDGNHADDEYAPRPDEDDKGLGNRRGPGYADDVGSGFDDDNYNNEEPVEGRGRPDFLRRDGDGGNPRTPYGARQPTHRNDYRSPDDYASEGRDLDDDGYDDGGRRDAEGRDADEDGDRNLHGDLDRDLEDHPLQGDGSNPEDDPEYGGPDDPEYGGPDDPEYGGPDDPEYGGPDDPEYGGPDDPEYGGPDDPEYGGPEDPEYGGPGDPEYGGPEDPAYGGPEDSEYEGPEFEPDYDPNAEDPDTEDPGDDDSEDKDRYEDYGDDYEYDYDYSGDPHRSDGDKESPEGDSKKSRYDALEGVDEKKSSSGKLPPGAINWTDDGTWYFNKPPAPHGNQLARPYTDAPGTGDDEYADRTELHYDEHSFGAHCGSETFYQYPDDCNDYPAYGVPYEGERQSRAGCANRKQAKQNNGGRARRRRRSGEDSERLDASVGNARHVANPAVDRLALRHHNSAVAVTARVPNDNNNNKPKHNDDNNKPKHNDDNNKPKHNDDNNKSKHNDDNNKPKRNNNRRRYNGNNRRRYNGNNRRRYNRNNPKYNINHPKNNRNNEAKGHQAAMSGDTRHHRGSEANNHRPALVRVESGPAAADTTTTTDDRSRGHDLRVKSSTHRVRAKRQRHDWPPMLDDDHRRQHRLLEENLQSSIRHGSASLKHINQ